MPNTASAKKRLKQNEVHRTRNRAIKTAIKTQVKKVLAAAEAGDTATADLEYREAARKLDRASARHIYHKNMVARQKSRLQRVIKAAKQAG